MHKHQCLSLLKLCSSFKHFYQIHARIVISGHHYDIFLVSEFIRFLALSASGNLSYARLVLDRSECSVRSSWNILIRCYASSDLPREAIRIFCEMRRKGITPDNLTLPFVLKACSTVSAIEEGRQAQADVVKCGLDCDVYVVNNLVHFYGCCKNNRDARKVFDEMSMRSVVSWNAVITSCIQNLCFGDGIEYFVKMRNDGFEPDETTMVIVLSACAELGNLSLGRWVHSQVIGRGMILNCKLGTALVDMYAKCGALNYCKLVFDRMDARNVWTWSAMILGLAQHGFAKEALELFENMITYSLIPPNYVTFLGVLCACSHAGLVDEGYRYFHDMKRVYGIEPMMIHYGAMVDVLGRSGRLKEGYAFIVNMPIEADPIVWRTLLSACSVHDVNNNDGIWDEVRNRLLKLEPRRSGNFVIIANTYAEVGMWEKAAKVRRRMRDGGLKKMAGESCVEISGSIHRFFSGHDSRVDFEVMYQLLDRLNLHMRMIVSSFSEFDDKNKRKIE